MYRVMIVDDEMIVRQAVKTLIRWDDGRFEFAGSAANGKSALRTIRESRPDIVITDIKMPEMDGIELIRRLKEDGFDGEILVLSNYNDFELVREALRMGAHDYVLKLTIKTDSLMTCLEEIAAKLERKGREPGGRATSAARPEKERLRAWLEAVIEADAADTADAGADEGAGKGADAPAAWHDALPWPGETMLFFLTRYEADGTRRDVARLQAAMDNLADDLFPGSRWAAAVPAWDADVLLAAAYASEDAGKAHPEELAKRIVKLMSMYYNESVEVVYSSPAAAPDAAADELRRCKEAQALLFYRVPLDSCRSNAPIPSDGEERLRAFRSKLPELAARHPAERIAEWTGQAVELVQEAKRHRVPPKGLKRALTSEFWEVSKAFDADPQAPIAAAEWIERIQEAQSDAELIDAFDRLREEAFAFARAPGATKASRPEIRKALEYIEANYARRISIAELAALANLSEPYFCQVFKAETGKSILTYLNGIRMQRAYELLAGGNYLVKQAASEVGIHDPFYFNRLFRKHFGISPKEVKPRERT